MASAIANTVQIGGDNSSSFSSSFLQTTPPLPPRLRIGRKKPHWLLEAPIAAVEDDAATALRRRLASLGTSELSLFAISEFDSEFRRNSRLRRRLRNVDSNDGVASLLSSQHQRDWQQRPATCLPKVRFFGLPAEDGDCFSGSENGSDSRPATVVGGRLAASATPVEDHDASSDVDSVSQAGDVAFPVSLSISRPLPPDSDVAARAESRRSAALRTLSTVTGAGDSKRHLADAFCDSAWPRTRADFARPRSVTYGQNLRLHPALADTIRAGIIAGRREFDAVSFAGLSELDRIWPSIAKTRHDRVINWLLSD